MRFIIHISIIIVSLPTRSSDMLACLIQLPPNEEGIRHTLHLDHVQVLASILVKVIAWIHVIIDVIGK